MIVVVDRKRVMIPFPQQVRVFYTTTEARSSVSWNNHCLKLKMEKKYIIRLIYRCYARKMTHESNCHIVGIQEIYAVSD